MLDPHPEPLPRLPAHGREPQAYGKVVDWATQPRCRRAGLLGHFGERLSGGIGEGAGGGRGGEVEGLRLGLCAGKQRRGGTAGLCVLGAGGGRLAAR